MYWYFCVMGEVNPDLVAQNAPEEPFAKCGNMDTLNIANAMPSSECEPYNEPDCIKTLKVNVTFILKGDGTGNFTPTGPPMNVRNPNDPDTYNSSLPADFTGQDYAERLICKVNSLMDNNTPDNMCNGWYYYNYNNPLNPYYDPSFEMPPAPPPTKIRFSLQQVRYIKHPWAYIHTNEELVESPPTPNINDSAIDDLNTLSYTGPTGNLVPFNVPNQIELYVYPNTSNIGSGVAFGGYSVIFFQMNEDGSGKLAGGLETHELGHVLGLKHTMAGMNCYNNGMFFNCKDVSPVETYYGCQYFDPTTSACEYFLDEISGWQSVNCPSTVSPPYSFEISDLQTYTDVLPQFACQSGIGSAAGLWSAPLCDQPEEIGSNIMNYSYGSVGHYISPCQLGIMHGMINSSYLSHLDLAAPNLYPLVNINGGGASLSCHADGYCGEVGEIVTLDAGNPWGEGTSYLWSNGETTQVITEIITENNTDIYSVTVTGANGCWGSDNIRLTNPPITVDLGDDVVACVNAYLGDVNQATYISLIAETPGWETDQVTYEWGVWHPGTLSWQTPTYFDATPPAGYFPYGNVNEIETYLPGGEYVYGVTVTSANGCTASDEVNVTMHEGPQPTLIGDAVAPGQGIFACADETMVLSVSPNSDDFEYVSYLWSNGSTTPSATFLPTDPTGSCCPYTTNDGVIHFYDGTYAVTVTDANGCTNAAGGGVFWIATPNIVIEGNNNICGADGMGSTTLTATVTNPTALPTGGPILDPPLPTGSAFVYNWSTGETTQSITVSAPGTYSVTVAETYATINNYITTCDAEMSIDVTATPPILPNLTALPSICTNADPLNLSSYVSNFASVSGGVFIISNSIGVLETIPSPGNFNPSNFPPDTYYIQYMYQFGNCAPGYSQTQALTLTCCSPAISTDAIPSYCFGNDITISATPVGGTFVVNTPTGAAIEIAGNIATLNDLGIGNYTLTYTLPNGEFCPNVATTQTFSVAMCCNAPIVPPIDTPEEAQCCELTTAWLIDANNPSTTATTPDLQWNMDNYAYTVQNSGTWTQSNNELNTIFGSSASININADLIIPSGKNITMNNIQLNFGPKGRIIVQRNASLTLDNNTKLYGTCTMWQGIRVLGPGYGINRSTGNYGKLRIVNNADVEIAQAIIGIAAMRTPLLDVYNMAVQLTNLSPCTAINDLACQNIFPIVLQAATNAGVSTAGGAVVTESGDFVNCFQGINLSFYNNSALIGTTPTTIQNSTFAGSATAPLPFPFNSISPALSSETGIYAEKYSRLSTLNNCIFARIKYGIQAFNTNSWNISTNTFESCSVGASIANQPFSLNSTSLSANDFNICTIAIQALGGSIRTKTNQITGLGIGNSSFGIAAVQTRFSINNDYIDQTSAALLLLNNSQNANIAQECVMTNNNIGAWMAGNNGISQLRCNQFITQDIPILTMDDIELGINGAISDQGFCFGEESDTPADNVFLGAAFADIVTLMADPFIYFHRDVPQLTPLIFDFATPPNATLEPCPWSGEEVTCSTWQDIPDGLIGSMGDEKEINYLLSQKLNYYLSETKDTAAALALLYSVNTDYAKQLQIGVAMDDKNYAEVDAKKETLSSTNDETLRYKQLLTLQRNLAASGRTELQITAAEETLLRDIAASHTLVAMDARVMLYSARGEEIFVQLPQLPNLIADSLMQLQLHFKTDQNGAIVQVQPNPAHQTLYLNYDLTDHQHAHIQLFDLTGRAIYRQALTEKGNLSIDVSNWANGIYYYQITSHKGMVRSDKISIINP
jgi:hypothetical protein